MTIHYPTGSRSENQQLPLADRATASKREQRLQPLAAHSEGHRHGKSARSLLLTSRQGGFILHSPIQSTYGCPASEGLLGISQKTRQTRLFLIFRLSGKGKRYGQILQEVLKCLAHMKPPNVILLQQRLGGRACITPPEEQKVFLLSLPSHRATAYR